MYCIEPINHRPKAALASFKYDSMSKRLKGKTHGFAPCTGGGVNYNDGRRPGSLGITLAVKQRQLQKQKPPSQPQPPTQTMCEGHLSRRGPTPWRLGRRARAGGLIVLGRSSAPPPTVQCIGLHYIKFVGGVFIHEITPQFTPSSAWA